MPNMEIMQRLFLPHWFVPNAAHFITYRLAGTIPAAVVANLKSQKEEMLRRQPDRVVVHKRLFKAYENELDANCEIDWLRQPRIASMIRQNLYHHDGEKYVLHAYCNMPNHVHVLLTPHPDRVDEGDSTAVGEAADSSSPVSAIMHSLKSYTANQQTGYSVVLVGFGSRSRTIIGSAMMTN